MDIYGTKLIVCFPMSVLSIMYTEAYRIGVSSKIISLTKVKHLVVYKFFSIPNIFSIVSSEIMTVTKAIIVDIKVQAELVNLPKIIKKIETKKAVNEYNLDLEYIERWAGLKPISINMDIDIKLIIKSIKISCIIRFIIL